MTKEPERANWESNYSNKKLSGIEVKDKDGILVNFVTIKHDEILDNNTPHRITINLDENEKPRLPPRQTFDEIIQAKRRQQMLLYGSGSSNSGALLSDRTARRVAAAARQTASAASLSRRSMTGISRRTSSNRNRSRSRKKPRRIIKSSLDPAERIPTVTPKKVVAEPPENVDEPTPGTSAQVITSMKDLNKQNAMFKSVDPKEVKLLLKSALPGSSIVLPNGTVIKKSRRGGARAGAGRKRSRPLPPGQQGSTPRNSSSNQTLSSNSSSFSSLS